MLYSIYCYDKNDSSERRKSLRNDHISYLKKFEKKIVLAGPLLNENEEPLGSLLVLNFLSKQEAEIFSKNDPYFLGGLFNKIEIYRFKQVY
ncbi:MAG: hypothetical protein CMP25_02520 [Rickettsiales bacterium]|nr:hypothetical protein [Rickettsiales bacterium]|tara:strand:+ start:353 stop:625 length:273 start_codon:yes stop_codon:yes gene_type:complete